ncbi:MAG: ATP-binding protein [Acidobacteria bacterium]|nr:ATP-binding protein [Acidobacteriota bacterium]
MRLSASLSVRLAVAAALLGVGGAAFVLYDLRHATRAGFLQAAVEDASNVTEVIRRATRAGMLENRWQDVYAILKDINDQPGVERIRLLRKDGTIVSSSDPTELNQRLSLDHPSCAPCHDPGPPKANLPRAERIHVSRRADGTRVLGMIEPIPNEPACTGSCHVHKPDQKILGVLVTEVSLAAADRRIEAATRRAFLGAALSMLLLAGMIVATHAYLLRRRMRPLFGAIGRLGKGDYAARVAAGPPDEFAEVSVAFNRMASDLEEAHRELQNWARTLRDRVDERTRELRQTQDQVIQSERLAGLGRLAAVVAHELNNPLAGVLVMVRRARKALARDSFSPEQRKETAGWLEMVDQEVARCGKIVQDLLAFSRHRRASREPVLVNEVASRALRLLGHKLDLAEVDLIETLDPKNPQVVGDTGQIQQALMAVLINAVEAMPQGGALEVATRGRGDGGVEIEIKDSGIGIAAEDLPQIFEPFFTTKADGQGVGLGLSVVYGIVSRHGGRLDIASTPAQGTRVVIQLPAEPPESGPANENDDGTVEPSNAGAPRPYPGGENDG